MDLNLIKSVEKKFRGIDKGFQFLDYFLDQCKKLNQEQKEQKEEKNIKIFDYRDSKVMYFNDKEIQKFYSHLYIDYFYEIYFLDYIFYQKFIIHVGEIVEIFDLEPENSAITCNFIIRSFLGCFYILDDNKVDKNTLLSSLEKNLSRAYPVSLSLDLAKILINSFIEQNFIESLDSNNYRLSDSCFFLHFKFLSLSVVKIYPENSYDISYGCIYNLNNLPNVITNFLLDFNSSKKLLENFNTEQDALFLENFFKDFYSLNNFYLELNSKDEKFKELISFYFFKKLVINSYCFHVIITSCFEFYYYQNTKNILYDKSPFLKLNY